MKKTREALTKMIERTGMGGISFFGWFGYIGKRISEEENKEVLAREKAEGEGKEEDKEEETDDEVDELEVFPDGGDLAHCIAEDLWPSAIRWFSKLGLCDFETSADWCCSASSGTRGCKRRWV